MCIINLLRELLYLFQCTQIDFDLLSPGSGGLISHIFALPSRRMDAMAKAKEKVAVPVKKAKKKVAAPSRTTDAMQKAKKQAKNKGCSPCQEGEKTKKDKKEEEEEKEEKEELRQLLLQFKPLLGFHKGASCSSCWATPIAWCKHCARDWCGV